MVAIFTSVLREYIREALLILTESKQSLINIGFPPILASLLMQEFGKHGVMIGRWVKDYFDTSRGGSWLDRIDERMAEYIELYDAIHKGPEEYWRVRQLLTGRACELERDV